MPAAGNEPAEESACGRLLVSVERLRIVLRRKGLDCVGSERNRRGLEFLSYREIFPIPLIGHRLLPEVSACQNARISVGIVSQRRGADNEAYPRSSNWMHRSSRGAPAQNGRVS